MQIQFKELQVTSIKYNSDTFNKSITADKLETTLKFDTQFSDDNDKAFGVNFIISLFNQEFNLKIYAIGHFITTETINEDFKKSSFLTINAPAIAYPYLRAFVSNLILNMGYNPVVLPTVNFLATNDNIDKV
jgi:preprotein translocase subunit SecB